MDAAADHDGSDDHRSIGCDEQCSTGRYGTGLGHDGCGKRNSHQCERENPPAARRRASLDSADNDAVGHCSIV
jgi:hypothetical protein